jgi:hypothetical protein
VAVCAPLAYLPPPARPHQPPLQLVCDGLADKHAEQLAHAVHHGVGHANAERLELVDADAELNHLHDADAELDHLRDADADALAERDADALADEHRLSERDADHVVARDGLAVTDRELQLDAEPLRHADHQQHELRHPDADPVHERQRHQ